MAERKRVAKTRRREKKNVPTGHVHVQATFHNTIITITGPSGATIAGGSAGVAGFKGSRKSTPYAAAMSADGAARRAMEHGMRQVEVFVKGPGAGREQAIRSLQAAGLGGAPTTPPRPPRGAPPQAVRIRRPAAREAEGAPCLQRVGAPVPRLLRAGRVAPRRDRREPPAPARDASRQRRLPHGFPAHPGPPLGTPAHFFATGRAAGAASYQPRPGARITVRERSRSTAPFKTASETLRTAQVPEWLSVDPEKLAGGGGALPRREQMPADLNEQLG